MASLVGLASAGPEQVALDLRAIDVPLALLKLTTRDLRVKASYAEDQVGGGALRLSSVTDGLRSAVGSATGARELGLVLTEGTDLPGRFETLGALLDVGPVRATPPTGPFHATAPLAMALAAPDKRQELDPQAPAPDGEPRLPIEVREAAAALVYGVARANGLLARMTKDAPPGVLGAVRQELPSVLSSLFRQQAVDEAAVLRPLRAAVQVDLRDIISAAAAVVGSVAEARGRLAELPREGGFLGSSAAAVPILFAQETDFGDVVIAGTGRNVHQKPAAILIDLGGDDRYEVTPTKDAPPVQVIIDLSGDDTYEAQGPFGPSAALLGVSVVVDEAGDDLHVARDPFSLGAAVCGVGLLVDAAGNDRYLGDCFGEGAAIFGLGLLLDGGGDDLYDARMCSQGFGCVKGVGALVDLGGEDHYRAGGGSADATPGQHRLPALSQGFGWGLREYAPGGVGILADAQGPDVYTAGDLSQGAGYWYGEGILYDGGGNDTYVGGDTSQGAGAFLALGHLLDESGDDRYVAGNASQGVGHDLGIGVLWDAAGDDTYVADRMAQAAASRGGIGIAVDLAGDDSYRASVGARGHVPLERGARGVAVFIDGGGTDSYNGPGGDGRLWVSGEWGAGLDLPAGGLASLRTDLPATSGRITFPIRLPSATAPLRTVETGGVSDAEVERLWVQATTAQELGDRAQAMRAIARLGEKAVPHIVGKFQSPDLDAARGAWSLLAQIGSPAVPELLRIVADGSAREAQMAMAVLGQIADPRAALPLVQQAKAPQWRRRAAAAASMGALRGEDTIAALEGLLRDPDEDVRRSAVVALGIRGAAESAVPISEMLGDPVYSVRFAAADALVKLGVPCPPHVFSLVGCEQPEVRHLSIETFGRLGSKDSLDILLGLLQSQDWGDRAFAAEAIGRIGDLDACRKLEVALANERNGLVLAKARTALNSTKLQAAF